jgi:hypothetical protein
VGERRGGVGAGRRAARLRLSRGGQPRAGCDRDRDRPRPRPTETATDRDRDRDRDRTTTEPPPGISTHPFPAPPNGNASPDRRPRRAWQWPAPLLRPWEKARPPRRAISDPEGWRRPGVRLCPRRLRPRPPWRPHRPSRPAGGGGARQARCGCDDGDYRCTDVPVARDRICRLQVGLRAAAQLGGEHPPLRGCLAPVPTPPPPPRRLRRVAWRIFSSLQPNRRTLRRLQTARTGFTANCCPCPQRHWQARWRCRRPSVCGASRFRTCHSQSMNLRSRTCSSSWALCEWLASGAGAAQTSSAFYCTPSARGSTGTGTRSCASIQ